MLGCSASSGHIIAFNVAIGITIWTDSLYHDIDMFWLGSRHTQRKLFMRSPPLPSWHSGRIATQMLLRFLVLRRYLAAMKAGTRDKPQLLHCIKCSIVSSLPPLTLIPHSRELLKTLPQTSCHGHHPKFLTRIMEDAALLSHVLKAHGPLLASTKVEPPP